MNKQPHRNKIYVQLKDPDEIRIICIRGKKNIQHYRQGAFNRIVPQSIYFILHCFTADENSMKNYHALTEKHADLLLDCPPNFSAFMRGLTNPVISL